MRPLRFVTERFQSFVCQHHEIASHNNFRDGFERFPAVNRSRRIRRRI